MRQKFRSLTETVLLYPWYQNLKRLHGFIELNQELNRNFSINSFATLKNEHMLYCLYLHVEKSVSDLCVKITDFILYFSWLHRLIDSTVLGEGK